MIARSMSALALALLVTTCGPREPQAKPAEEPATEAAADTATADSAAAPPRSAEPRPAQPGREPARSSAGDAVRTGRVAVTGTEGATFTILQIDTGSIGLLGDLEPELRRLSGATVRVTGTPGPGFPGAAITVRAYDVVAIDGRTPVVGIIERRGDAVWIAGLQDTRLLEPPADLRERIGNKVWVTGIREARGIRVQSYGILREW